MPCRHGLESKQVVHRLAVSTKWQGIQENGQTEVLVFHQLKSEFFEISSSI
ncbi:Uncharacterised protein [Vibrio cholerae]|nr:Uncharacterised protein [Vibrio cholerae]CSC70588.1 Uncharacterised protein [Vibrio cholerae]